MLLEKHKLDPILKRLQELYLNYPPEEWDWVVSYSGGKDSTVLLKSVIEFADIMGFDFEVVHHDTGVEYPILKNHVRKVLNTLEDIGIKITITTPEKSFFEYMIERGYTFPRWNFRWCCVYLKWKPVADYFANRNKCLNLIGIRGDENRRPRMFIRTSYRRGKRLDNVVVASPLIDVNLDFVWNVVLKENPFGVRKLYPVKEHRFGCWVCTVSNGETLRLFHPDLFKVKYELVEARCKGLLEFIRKLEEYSDFLGIKIKTALKIQNDTTPCKRLCNICQIKKWKERTLKSLNNL